MVQNRAKTSFVVEPGKKHVLVTSFLDAPPESIFRVITDPEMVPRWWGPKIFTTTVEEMDVRPGGSWRYVQEGPDGNTYAFSGVYREVDPPRLLSYTFNYEPMPGHEHMETLTFEEVNGKTKAVNTVSFDSVEDRDGMVKTGLETGSVESMNRLYDLLEELYSGKRATAVELPWVVSRMFDAPVEEVWRAFTDPERITRWWGPKDFTAPFAKMDLRVGGKYTMAMRGPDGKDYWSTGIYKEIIPHRKIVLIDSFADKDGNVVPATYYGMSSSFPLGMEITLTFEEFEGKTKFTLRYSDVGMMDEKDLEAMKQGWSESLDKLQDILGKAEIVARRYQ
jgi:uncharacterized protein YndB with AHSA1/START domain